MNRINKIKAKLLIKKLESLSGKKVQLKEDIDKKFPEVNESLIKQLMMLVNSDPKIAALIRKIVDKHAPIQENKLP